MRLILALAFAVACSDKGDDSAAAESDADTDADSDTDTDSDTDSAPTDTKHPYANCDANVFDDWDAAFDDATYFLSYDENEQETYYEADLDDDGTIDETSTFTYTASGQVMTDVEDTDGDGIADETYWYTYDFFDALLTIEADIDGDGKSDTRTVYSNDAGIHISASYYEDGVLLKTGSWIYDKDGELDAVEVDLLADDGDVNDVYEITIETDKAGNVTYTQDYDQGNDGSIESTYRTVTNAAGDALEIWSDTDGDGSPEEVVTYTRDKDGGLISYIAEAYGTKSGDYTFELDYDGFDEWDRLILVNGTADYVDFGIFHLVRTYEWHCH